jgi:GST-like protein
MDNLSSYTPPKIWSANKESGGRFANINRPSAGPTHEKKLPVGRHPLQLYSLGTPNGVKVNRVVGEPNSQLHDRHDASDFETGTQDKLVKS